ncbi:uncharacterized protein LOC108819281 [Raphanus sativus]|uniref:Uncharacterized protein LOC108819281 n=1 Tax=Raphanus sativus TaxID=3726 RepID=A0A9W3C8M5_RAPSA|nr:uncharacterized protein LOC108819281 [Raphanus sativus]
MEVMFHSSSFLLPTDKARYALVVLNQNLPRFTPLLWEHEQQDFVCVLMEALIVSTMSYPFSSLMKTALLIRNRTTTTGLQWDLTDTEIMR